MGCRWLLGLFSIGLLGVLWFGLVVYGCVVCFVFWCLCFGVWFVVGSLCGCKV